METSRIGTAAKELFAAVTGPGAGERLGLEGWLEVLSETQEALNVLAGVQAVAMAQVAAFDAEESGLGERRHRGLGHQALDAPDLVAARVGCSAQAASTRMGVAVAQVASMPALVAAMGAGRVDGFRAAVVADELADAPEQVRAEVSAVLEASGRLAAETAGPLRRRTRRLLADRAPEVLAGRAAGERERRGVHRSTAGLGVEHWAAWLPVESSRPAWAAVTTLAQDYLRAGQAETLAQARADALTDLILGQATTTVVLHPTVPLVTHPAPTASAAGADLLDDLVPGADLFDDLVPVAGYGAPGQTFIRRGHLRELAGLAGSTTRRVRASGPAEGDGGSMGRGSTRVRVGECLALDPATGAVTGVLDPGTDLGSSTVRVPETDGYRPSAQVERLVKVRDGRCRFPGCQVPVRFVDLDHVRAYDLDDPAAGGPTSPPNLAGLCRRHHRIKQLPGWRVELLADGTMRWTDPTSVTRTSWPEDHRPPEPRPVPRPDRPSTPAQAALEPAVRPGSWEAEQRAADLEPYSLLEDQLLDVLLAAGFEVPADSTAHRTLPRPPRRRPGRDLDGEAGDSVGYSTSRASRIRIDRSHATTPTRSIDLHPDTLAEFTASVDRRNAPPF